MKFALFYEIPDARPWDKKSEWRACKNTLEQAVRGDEAGFHSVWTVEHHFLEDNIPDEAVMDTIDLMGRYVVPEFK